MTPEQKDLLLKDLCVRLLYGVKVQCLSHQIPLKILSINPNGVTWVTGDKGYPFEVDWKDCRPYLFPLSSMTEEQKKEISKRYNYYNRYQSHVEITNHREGYWDTDNSCNLQDYLWLEDWYNKNHFDYRGLIPMGLANDATGLNIYKDYGKEISN